ncbi:MAG: hypothetical protein U5K69_06160 [Balneolaceae bacterium]|nr:hypothetical protein [Balneolaceae bacterium]
MSNINPGYFPFHYSGNIRLRLIFEGITFNFRNRVTESSLLPLNTLGGNNNIFEPDNIRLKADVTNDVFIRNLNLFGVPLVSNKCSNKSVCAALNT